MEPTARIKSQHNLILRLSISLIAFIEMHPFENKYIR